MSIICWLVVVFVLFVDQISKFLAEQYLTPNDSAALIKNIFHLTLVRNTGAAFGLFKNQTLFFILISIVAIVFIFAYLRKKTDNFLTTRIALAMVLGGALGNLVDRLRFGYVIDFLDFRIWPVFNLADSAITIGVAILVLSILKEKITSAQGGSASGGKNQK